jgi:hypothetical protein
VEKLGTTVPVSDVRSRRGSNDVLGGLLTGELCGRSLRGGDGAIGQTFAKVVWARDVHDHVSIGGNQKAECH